MRLHEKAERTSAKVPLYPDLYHTKQYTGLYHSPYSADYMTWLGSEIKPFTWTNYEKAFGKGQTSPYAPGSEMIKVGPPHPHHKAEIPALKGISFKEFLQTPQAQMTTPLAPGMIGTQQNANQNPLDAAKKPIEQLKKIAQINKTLDPTSQATKAIETGVQQMTSAMQQNQARQAQAMKAMGAVAQLMGQKK